MADAPAVSAEQVKSAPIFKAPAGTKLYQNVTSVIQVYTIGGEQHTLRPGETVYAKEADVVKIPSLREFVPAP